MYGLGARANLSPRTLPSVFTHYLSFSPSLSLFCFSIPPTILYSLQGSFLFRSLRSKQVGDDLSVASSFLWPPESNRQCAPQLSPRFSSCWLYTVFFFALFICGFDLSYVLIYFFISIMSLKCCIVGKTHTNLVC